MPGQTKSVAKGISVLGIAGIVCKFVGVFFSIFLNRIDADIATAFYLVYPTYALLLTISSAGLPVAVSRMVAGFLAKDDPRSAKNVFYAAMKILFTIGLFFSILMVLLNRQLTLMTNAEETALGFYAISPCVAIVCALSAFRGFFQGQQDMVPTAISQLIEQVGKVFLSLFFAWYGYTFFAGNQADQIIRVQYGAAGALLGITLSEIFALIYMLVLYLRRRKDFNTISQLSEQSSPSSRSLMKRLVLISIPITISACIIPLSQFIDSAMMIDRMENAGLELSVAKSSYGVFTSVVKLKCCIAPLAEITAAVSTYFRAISCSSRETGENKRISICINEVILIVIQANLPYRLIQITSRPCQFGTGRSDLRYSQTARLQTVRD
jgi:stage V sporulation protein B